MINIIWGVLIVVSIIFALLTGNIDTINKNLNQSIKDGLEIIKEMIPLLVLWMGLMKIAENSGLLAKIAHLISRPLKYLFPSVPQDNKAFGFIASNIAVNMMGLGSAATPFGLKAMEELQTINPKKDTASDAMITFLVINTTGITIIPTTVIALRTLHGSANPTEIIITSLIATLCASIGGLTIDYFIRRRHKHE